MHNAPFSCREKTLPEEQYFLPDVEIREKKALYPWSPEMFRSTLLYMLNSSSVKSWAGKGSSVKIRVSKSYTKKLIKVRNALLKDVIKLMGINGG